MANKSFNVRTIFSAKDLSVGATMKRIGKSAANIARQSGKVTAVSGAAIFAIGKVAASYQKSINRVEALTGATTDEMTKLSNLAKDLGANTQFSASEAADAMGFLGMAGFEVNEILSATPDLLNLAAAANIDLARAADIASNIMGAFGKDASQTGEVADILAAATASANVDMEMLAETMKDAAPIAKQFGASLKDTSVLAGFLGNIGIQGSKAGTAMKNIFLTLSAPPAAAKKWFTELNIETTKLGKNGKRVIRPVQDTFTDLGSALQKLDPPKRLEAIKDIFGKIPIAAAASLADDLGKSNSQFVKLAMKMNDVDGRAQSMAETMNKGAAGAFKKMESAARGVAIAMGESGILDAAESLFTSLAKFFTFLNTHAPLLTKIIGFVFILSGVITGLAFAVVAAVKIFGVLKLAIGFVTIGFKLLTLVMSANPIGLIVLAVVALIAGFVALANHVGGIGEAFKILGQTILQSVLFPINMLIKSIVMLLKLGSMLPVVGDKLGLAGEKLSAIQDQANLALTGTTNILPASRLVEAIIAGDGTAAKDVKESTPENSLVQVDVNDNTREDKNVSAKAVKGDVKLKLSPAT